MLDTLALLGESETVDELGLGTVRDTLADLMFPGTSTVQTRPVYYLLVPWLYRELERRRVGSADIAKKARAGELKLIDVLRRASDQSGLIGREAGTRLKRLPSNIYWNGLHELGILRYEGSQADYHRSLDGWHARTAVSFRDDDGNPLANTARWNWDPNLPSTPRDFPDEASMDLRRPDAEYLRDRVRSIGTTVWRWLVEQPTPWVEVDFPWHHPRIGDLPAELREIVDHARVFSEVMHGAALLYNLILAEGCAARRLPQGEKVETYNRELVAWVERMRDGLERVRLWDRRAFWQLIERHARVPQTRPFVEKWLELEPWASPKHATSERARKLIIERERAVKRAPGRIRIENTAALQRWGGVSGDAQLRFRWRVAQRHSLEILTALTRRNDARTA